MSDFTLQLLLGTFLAAMLLWALLARPRAGRARVDELWRQRARMLLPFVLLYLALLLAGHWLLAKP